MGRPKKKSRRGLNIVDIPRQILCTILLKLPAWSIKQCSCVCTTFRDIISDSEFKQVYSSQACVVLYNSFRLWCIDSCSLSATTPSDGLQPLNKSRFITFELPTLMNLVNSSHGLVCLHSMELSHSSSHYYICNPLLGEIVRVPPAPTADCWYSAFGFDPKSKHYKILRLVHKSNKSDAVVAELYQSGDDKWIVIQNAPTPPAGFRCAFDPSLNGALHWLPCGFRLSNFIYSFDLHTNEFKLLPPPSHLITTPMWKISVGVLKGCLCLCYITKDGQFETWVMEKYGVQESWTKVFTIDTNSYHGRLRLLERYRPIGFGSSGDMWFKDVCCLRSMVSYNAEAGVFRQIDMEGGPSPIFDATAHVFSFVSLKDMVNRTDTHLHSKKSQRN